MLASRRSADSGRSAIRECSPLARRECDCAGWRMSNAGTAQGADGQAHALVGSEPSLPPDGLSAFAARVLDQLSVSAWLPAGVLVAGLFVVVKLRFNDCRAYQTLADLGDTGGPTLFMLTGAVVLLTTVTQAFEFGSIRVLEGYWGDGALANVLARACVWQPTRRRESATRRRQAYRVQAFESARPKLVKANVAPEVIAYLAATVRREPKPGLNDSDRQELNRVDWRHYASAATMRRLDEFDRRIKALPRGHRVMPTRLGNVLRAYEDKANEHLRGSVSGMVQRVYHRLPAHIQIELDQYRNRIGLYSTLVAVSAILG